MKKFFKVLIFIILFLIIFFTLLSIKKVPDEISYGVSFSKFHSDELNLDWKKTYLAILDDLIVTKLRLSAHWPMVEPENDKFNFVELDYQMREAEKRGASVILAVGRRLPGWPECHDPEWTENLTVEEREQEILQYIEKVVSRYKDYENILYWQVENEPFLFGFARHHCGGFKEEFLKEEIALVKSIDPERKILVTDSGELSTWFGAYESGDVFGTTLYVYIWTHWSGPARYPIGPWFFRAKRNLVEIFKGDKEGMIIELSAEPWLLQPIAETDMKILLDRMSLEKLKHTAEFASKTSFKEQYLWGAEWWYWMKEKGYPEYWEWGKELFSEAE